MRVKLLHAHQGTYLIAFIVELIDLDVVKDLTCDVCSLLWQIVAGSSLIIIDEPWFLFLVVGALLYFRQARAKTTALLNRWLVKPRDQPF